MRTLAECLTKATAYWSSKGPSSRMMPIRASVCVAEVGPHLEASSLGPEHGTLLLTSLQARRLKKSTVVAYYAAFRRMLALAGVSTVAWPSAGTPPRRVREPLLEADLERLIAWLVGQEYDATVWLARVLQGTGMRVEVEALSPDAWTLKGDLLHVVGKGGHERVIPVDSYVKVLLAVSALHKQVPYATHLSRWNKGVKALGISSRLPTPHAVRHLYATRVYAKCKDLLVVKELLGHSDINTTARYVGVDMEALRRATTE